MKDGLMTGQIERAKSKAASCKFPKLAIAGEII